MGSVIKAHCSKMVMVCLISMTSCLLLVGQEPTLVMGQARNHEYLLKYLYETRAGKFLSPFITHHRWLNIFLGRYHDLSISRRHIKPFIKRFNIDMNEAEKPVEEYQTFNEFFTRKLKPGSRPIVMDAHTIVAPADSAVLVLNEIKPENSFPIKNARFNLATFLQDEMLAQKYYGGTMLIFRLGPWDYHRFHAPINCIPSAACTINGRFDSVDPIAFSPDVQPLHTNERRLAILQDTPCNDVVMVSVGALCVGKIVETYSPETFHRKGDELGYFCFGGSTVILIFKPGYINVDTTIIANSAHGIETLTKVGQPIASVLNPTKQIMTSNITKNSDSNEAVNTI